MGHAARVRHLHDRCRLRRAQRRLGRFGVQQGCIQGARAAGRAAVHRAAGGRPHRIIVAATNYNPTSVFAWNVLLYNGLFALVALYLWTLMEKRMNPWSKPVGLMVFAWRIILTTGTGLIF